MRSLLALLAILALTAQAEAHEKALAKQRQLATGLSALLDAKASALPRSMRHFPHQVVRLGASAARTLAVTASPWLEQGGSYRQGVNVLSLHSEDGEWDLSLRHAVEGAAPGWAAEQSYSVHRQNPWHALVDNALDKRPLVERAGISILGAGPVYSLANGIQTVVTERVTTDRLGKQGSVTRAARAHGDGTWLVQTRRASWTADDVSGVSQAKTGKVSQRVSYDRYLPDGRRLPLTKARGEEVWNAP